MRKMLIAAAMLLCLNVHGQVEVGVGGELAAPLLFNGFVKGHNHASAAVGARVAINYTPPDANFTGSVVAGIAPMMLPVVRFNGGQDVLYMNFANTNVSLLGRYRRQLNNEAALMFGIGAGVNMLRGNRVQISQRSENEIARIMEDSTFYNKATLPTVYLNVEYIRPINKGSKIYYGIGAQVQYMYFLDQSDSYRVDIVDKNFQYFRLQPKLEGHLVNPMVFLNLYYRI